MIMFNFHHSLRAQVKQRKNWLGVGTSALGCEFINKCFIIICLFFLLSFGKLLKRFELGFLAHLLLIIVNRGCNASGLFNNKQKVVNGIEMFLCQMMPNPRKILLSSLCF